jgi:hypothetical protein
MGDVPRPTAAGGRGPAFASFTDVVFQELTKKTRVTVADSDALYLETSRIVCTLSASEVPSTGFSSAPDWRRISHSVRN